MIVIYTDGAFSSTRNQGGWAFVVLKDGEKIHHSFFPEKHTTNNRMEIMGSLKAIEWCIENDIKEFTIITDSMYVIGTMTLNWKRKKNNDLWDIMDEKIKGLSIDWQHVKGHSGDKYNSLCDILAVEASHCNNLE